MTLRNIPVESRLLVSFSLHSEGDIQSTLRFKTRDSAFIQLDCYGVQLEVPLDTPVEQDDWDEFDSTLYLKLKATRTAI